jgi:histidine ammonia-lyase
MNTIFELNNALSIDIIRNILAENKTVVLSTEAKNRIVACRTFLDNKTGNTEQAFYGINTGFGSLCNTKISANELNLLQENLLLSHACGTGDEVPHEIVKIMLLLKAQSLAFGNSGVQLETVELLLSFFNHNILPVVFEQGSLGASGDLAPLAHLCIPLFGNGLVYCKNEENKFEKIAASDALNRFHLKAIQLKSKEGLALINGTQFMSAYGTFILMQAVQLFPNINCIAAMSLEAFDGRIEPFHASLHAVRPHQGQLAVSKQMRELLSGSELITQNKAHVQDPYAFRCIPQVHGASFDTIEYVKKVIETEIQSVTDNPNIFPDEDLIISGGNFHGQPLALALDFLAIALAELGSISERRTYQLISGTRGLPPFLCANPGLNSGFMIPQYTAASIVSQNKQLCSPASVDSIVSSNGQEDHVSMGANAATKCLKVYKNLERIVAIELMNAAQALEFRRPLKSTDAIENLHANYRTKVSMLQNDRYLHEDIQQSILFVQQLNETPCIA